MSNEYSSEQFSNKPKILFSIFRKGFKLFSVILLCGWNNCAEMTQFERVTIVPTDVLHVPDKVHFQL